MKWYEHPWAVIDFETTGPLPDCEPIEIGVVRFEGGEPVDRFTSLLRPTQAIAPEAFAAHGIEDAAVENAPTPDDSTVRFMLEDTLKGAGAFVAYHTPFDRTLFSRHFRSFDTDNDWIDPLVLVRFVDTFAAGQRRFRLAAACKRFNIAQEPTHRALDDALATGQLLWRLKDYFPRLSLSGLLREQAKLRDRQDEEYRRWNAQREVDKDQDDA